MIRRRTIKALAEKPRIHSRSFGVDHKALSYQLHYITEGL